MKCPSCQAEVYIDQVVGDSVFYSCMNRTCPNYRKSFLIVDGKEEEEKESTIKPYGKEQQ